MEQDDMFVRFFESLRLLLKRFYRYSTTCLTHQCSGIDMPHSRQGPLHGQAGNRQTETWSGPKSSEAPLDQIRWRAGQQRIATRWSRILTFNLLGMTDVQSTWSLLVLATFNICFECWVLGYVVLHPIPDILFMLRIHHESIHVQSSNLRLQQMRRGQISELRRVKSLNGIPWTRILVDNWIPYDKYIKQTEGIHLASSIHDNTSSNIKPSRKLPIAEVGV